MLCTYSCIECTRLERILAVRLSHQQPLQKNANEETENEETENPDGLKSLGRVKELAF